MRQDGLGFPCPTTPSLRRERVRFREFAHRAGPALPPIGLAPRGFSRLPILLPGRWALTPPFHPCQRNSFAWALSPAFLEDVSQVSCAMPPCCCAGGIFSVALSVTEPHRVELSSTPLTKVSNSTLQRSLRGRPLALQARCPKSSPALASLRRRCPDFPPVPIGSASDHPARPPTSIIA